MKLVYILKKVKSARFVAIPEDELNDLLSIAKVIEEKDTHISDKIRLLKLNGELLVQEKSNKNEYILRLMKNKKEAEQFINERMEIYDRMWDGCGCKVDYYK